MTHEPCQTPTSAVPATRGSPFWSRLHVGLALLTALIVPAASWMDGSGWLAWTMYSRSGSYRLTVHRRKPDGDRIPIAPTAMAQRASGTIRIALGGADHWRISTVWPTPYACPSAHTGLAF